ncbi:MAG: tetratricopeptide repeat protein [Planctomycetota bacterium]|jgi:tetratricopeptide (TPR) repeat protein
MNPKFGQIIITGLFLAVLSSMAQAELSKEQLYSLFAQANQAFKEANAETSDSTKAGKLYEKSILSYEKIISRGQIQNAGLYYNLANAYLLKGDLGRAILNYRRAQKLDTADANIQKNLTFARSQRLDKVTVKTEKRILQTLFFWHYDFSLKTKFALTCIFFAVCCIGLTLAIWFGRSPAATTIVVITGLFTICFLASVAVQTRIQAATICGVITADEVVARQGDGQNYAPSFKEPLHTGTEFDLLERRTGWLHIQLADDTDTWIPDQSADLI